MACKPLTVKIYFKRILERQSVEDLFSKLTLFSTKSPYRATYNNNTLLKNDISSAFSDISNFNANSDVTIELVEGEDAIKFIRNKYDHFQIKTSMPPFNMKLFNNICKDVANNQGIVLLNNIVSCPRCDGQGHIDKVKIDGLPDRIYLCEECDAMWEKNSPILKSTFRMLKPFLDERGISYGGAKREYEGYYMESDIIEEIENTDKW